MSQRVVETLLSFASLLGAFLCVQNHANSKNRIMPHMHVKASPSLSGSDMTSAKDVARRNSIIAVNVQQILPLPLLLEHSKMLVLVLVRVLAAEHP